MFDPESKRADRPFSHGLLDRDPGTRAALKSYFKIILLSTVLISLTIWAVLGIYWGANWRVYQGIHNMNGWIVDFDGGLIGSTVTQAYLNATGSQEQVSWAVVSPDNFPNGESGVIDAVLNERCWVAVVIHSGSSERLNAAISTADNNYNNSAVAVYVEEARNENSYIEFLFPQMQQPMAQAMAVFALEQARRLSPSNASTLLGSAPELILQPLNYTIENIRPFDVQVAEAVDFVGLIYLLILSFIAALANFQSRTIGSGLEGRLNLRNLIALRIITPTIVYFWLSWVYSMLSLFFHVPFERRFGPGGFVIFWMLSWMAMMALGLAIEAMITILTVRFIPFFLVPWIIVNVSVVFYPVEIMPTIFRYGFATPFYNVSRATRAIIFSTRNEVGLNFGVLFAWIGVSLVTIPLFQWHARSKAVRLLKQKEADAQSEKTQ